MQWLLPLLGSYNEFWRRPWIHTICILVFFCSFVCKIRCIKVATVIGLLKTICVLVRPSTFYASLYKLAEKSLHLPYYKQLGDRRLSSHVLLHVSFRVPNVFSRLPSCMTTVSTIPSLSKIQWLSLKRAAADRCNCRQTCASTG